MIIWGTYDFDVDADLYTTINRGQYSVGVSSEYKNTY